jgi:hypothetical protein
MTLLLRFPSVCALCIGLGLSWISCEASEARFVMTQGGDGNLRVELDGRHLTTHHPGGEHRHPYFFPILTEHGTHLTRQYPMVAGVPGEATDHPHHTGLWFTHGDVNGHDFWHSKETRIEQVELVIGEIVAGDDGATASFRTRNRWVGKDGRIQNTCAREHVFRALGDGLIALDICVTLEALEAEAVTFGDTKEGTMAIRVAPTLRVKGEIAAGKIINSEGDEDGAVWSKRAGWVSYSGPDSAGNPVGIMIIEHPKNVRYPTWWHARDYGLFAANPFGINDFEKAGARAGDLVIEAGGSVTFSYRVLFHNGLDVEGLREQAERYGDSD